jgi:carbon monoxide dehydrogenase subunit G
VVVLSGVVLAGGVDGLGLGDVDGDVVVGGDADGLRSPGRSPTRLLPDSVHPVSTPAARARTHAPVSNFFITVLLRSSFAPHTRVAIQVPRTSALDTLGRCTRPRFASEERARMKIEGSHDVPAARSKAWDAFLDPEVLRQAIPGCEKLEALGNDEYRAVMKIGVAAVKGTFEGKVKLADKKPPESYRLYAEGSGGPGFVRADTVITLAEIEGGTRVTYSADVQIGGLIAGVGQRMLGGVSKMMAEQFFDRMSQLLQGAA